MPNRIDHLVIVTPDLARGVAWAEGALGVPFCPGGRHDAMGTHNRLLKLQDEIYLEVIAADPAAARPVRPRWFGLDDLAPTDSPFLATWVVRTDDIAAGRAAVDADLAFDLGETQTLHRGPWSWQITIPPDGRAPLDGLAPALIQWPGTAHPSQGMADRGVRLIGLTLHHPEPASARRLLQALGLSGTVAVQATLPESAPYLDALLATPSGPCRLSCSRIHRP
jgi:hypothetical protein